MAFGRPTRYLQLDLNRIPSSSNSNNVRAVWDKSVEQASDQYKKRMVAILPRLFVFISRLDVSAQSLLRQLSFSRGHGIEHDELQSEIVVQHDRSLLLDVFPRQIRQVRIKCFFSPNLMFLLHLV